MASRTKTMASVPKMTSKAIAHGGKLPFPEFVCKPSPLVLEGPPGREPVAVAATDDNDAAKAEDEATAAAEDEA
jgi:hypothetical protein